MSISRCLFFKKVGFKSVKKTAYAPNDKALNFLKSQGALLSQLTILKVKIKNVKQKINFILSTLMFLG